MKAKKAALLYHKKVDEKIIEGIIEGLDCEISTYTLEDWNENGHKESLIFTYLSDEHLKDLIPTIADESTCLAILPHPEGVQSRIGYGVSEKLEEAIAHLNKQQEEVNIDLLFCNDQLVFNNIIIGDTFQLVTSKSEPQTGWLKRLWRLTKRFWYLRPFEIHMKAGKKKDVNTVVSGIVIVQYGKGSFLSRLLMDHSFANDGKLHAFLISPRSLAQLLLFGLRSIFDNRRLPPFSAHIKTDHIQFDIHKAIDFSIDGESLSAKSIEVQVKADQLNILPGRYLETTEQTGEADEIYRIKALPQKEAAEALAGKKLPFITHASTKEFQSIFSVLRENAELKNTYLVLMVLSTTLAAFGIFADSTPVVIGAMILAPLMAPIITMSMAILRQERKLIYQSARTIIAGLAAGFLCAMIVTWMTPLTIPNAEIMSRTKPSLLDLGIAVVSGIAGAYAHAREEIAKTLAGVAIAVALVPPLAVSGIGLAWFDFEIFAGAMLLLLTNLAGMVLAGALCFLLMGFSPFKLARKGVIISFIVVVIISLPLGYSFQRLVEENNIIEQVMSKSYESFELKEVNVVRRSPLKINITISADHNLSEEELDEIKESVEASLGREVEMDISVSIQR